MASPTDRQGSPSPSQLPPIPGSPAFTTSTANNISSYNLPLPPPPRPAHAVLTTADLEASQVAYSDLLATAKSYRQALAALSNAASAFGSSLEACARLKEARAEPLGPPGGASISTSFTTKGSCTADLLMGASGVHHLVANHQQILSETVYRSFEVPLLHELDKWRGAIDDEDESYQREVQARSKEIRRLEKEGLKLHKQRKRDVAKFREHLVELTTKLDGLTILHGEHARTLLRESQEASVKILDASCSLVRAEVDIFEGLARKGWSGGGLDDLLEKGHDLFANEDDALGAGGGAGAGAGEGTKLFSILPPKSILADTASDSSRLRACERADRADSLLVEPERYQSLAGAVDEDKDKGDAESIFSDLNQGRGIRPFSPQPIRKQTNVMLNPDSLLQGNEAELEGERDASVPGLRLEEDEIDEHEVSPWRDEGLHKEGESGNVQEQDVISLHTTTSTVNTTRDRDRRWSVTEDES